MKIKIALFTFLLPVLCFAQSPQSQSVNKEASQEQIYIPNNLEECFSELKKAMKTDDLEQFKKQEEKAVSSYHHSIGTWIRNNWGLWSGSRLAKYFNNMGVFHPDDMSSIILTSFHRRLNGADIALEKQIKIYKDYWNDMKKMDMVIKQLKKDTYNLDITGFEIAKSEFPPEKSSVTRQVIEDPACDDCFSYEVILENGTGRFWIHQTGGYSGVDILYGPGIIDENGKIDRKVSGNSGT